MTTLYRITKTQWRYNLETKQNVVVRRTVTYSAKKVSVTNTVKNARQNNDAAERFKAKFPRAYQRDTYTVDIEVADEPEFKQAGWCDKHGLFTELACVQCFERTIMASKPNDGSPLPRTPTNPPRPKPGKPGGRE